PGFVVALAARVRWPAASLAAVPVTFGMVAIGSAVTSTAGVPWNPWTALATLVVFLLLAVGYSGAHAWWRRRRGAAAHVAPGGYRSPGSADASAVSGRLREAAGDPAELRVSWWGRMAAGLPWWALAAMPA